MIITLETLVRAASVIPVLTVGEVEKAAPLARASRPAG